MNIGEVAEASGVSAKMIRYYEQSGLIRRAERSSGGYRGYEAADVHTLRFIRRARDLGFSIEQIAELLDLWRDGSRSSAQVRALALEHEAGLRRKMSDLRMMLRTLSELAELCEGEDRPDYPTMSDFASSRAGSSGTGSEARARQLGDRGPAKPHLKADRFTGRASLPERGPASVTSPANGSRLES